LYFVLINVNLKIKMSNQFVLGNFARNVTVF